MNYELEIADWSWSMEQEQGARSQTQLDRWPIGAKPKPARAALDLGPGSGAWRLAPSGDLSHVAIRLRT
jgi:hypothetical protein